MSDSDSEIRRAAVLSDKQLRHAIRVAEISGRIPIRDVMLLLLTHTTGLRITEVSLLKISDVMLGTGVLKREVFIRAITTKSHRARTVYLTHPKTIAAIEAWLAYRRVRAWCLTGVPDQYRGIDPESKLVLTRKGRAFEQSRKYKLMFDGRTDVYFSCDALQAVMTRLFKQAGIRGASSHRGRRGLATRVVAQTGDVELASILLGHSTIEEVRPYLNLSIETLRRAFEIAVEPEQEVALA